MFEYFERRTGPWGLLYQHRKLPPTSTVTMAYTYALGCAQLLLFGRNMTKLPVLWDSAVQCFHAQLSLSACSTMASPLLRSSLLQIHKAHITQYQV